jgi:HK97 family phage major capsid protein
MEKLQKLIADREAKVTEMEQILALADKETREVTEQEQARFDQLKAECEALAGKISAEEVILKLKAEVERAQDVLTPVMDRVVPPSNPSAAMPVATKITVPATVKRWGNLKAFRGADADVEAYKAGKFILAVAGNHQATDWCYKHGIMSAAQQENVNTRGGYLVPSGFDNAIIDLRDSYGVFARNARRVSMTSDVHIRPRRTGGLTAYFVGEDTAATESNKSWDQVTLTAQKIAILARITNELNEDAIISVADDLAGEIAWAFAKKIDECGFVGDGTSTYGGIFGVSPRLAAVNGVDDGGGLVKSADNVFADMVIGDLTKCISILPAYAHARAKWYCSGAVWGQVLLRLAAAAGGNTIGTLEAGGVARQFLGYPVELTEVLPTSDSNSQICVLFGDLALAADFGDRRQTTIKFSDSAYVGSTSVFESDETAVIGTMRFDINAHDVGTSTAAGPIIGLISHSA